MNLADHTHADFAKEGFTSVWNEAVATTWRSVACSQSWLATAAAHPDLTRRDGAYSPCSRCWRWDLSSQQQ